MRTAFIQLYRVGSLLTGKKKHPLLSLSGGVYRKWIKKNEPGADEIHRLKEKSRLMAYSPKIAVVMPVYNTRREWFTEALDSVITQIYENWELCVANDGSSEPHVKQILDLYCCKDRRIRIKNLEKNVGISGASNEALALVSPDTDFIAFMDSDDVLHPLALYEMAAFINENREADLIYSDEDKLTLSGIRRKPVFKPGWSPDLFLTYNYINHLAVCRKKWVNHVGGFRSQYSFSQDYDLYLRITELTTQIHHIPKILYHWRAVPGSSASRVDIRQEALEKSKQLLTETIKRRGMDGVVTEGWRPGTFRIKHPKRIIKKLFSFLPGFIQKWIRPLHCFTEEDKKYMRGVRQTALTSHSVKRMKEEIFSFSYRPKISIIMPVYNIEKKWLVKAIKSVTRQVYGNWELCTADDASSKTYIRKVLEKYRKSDPRIKVKFLEQNKGMSGAYNAALELASGEYAAFLDHDDELSRDSMFEVVKFLQTHREADIIFSDEDKLTMSGQRIRPVYKPGWDPELFLTYNYLCHLVVCRLSLISRVGGLRKGFEGSQDYDLLLRLTELTQNVFHIPKVLYHWRMIPGSAAAVVDAKSGSFERAKKALQEAMQRRGIPAEIVDGEKTGTFRIIKKETEHR